jgi:mannosylglycerate hydrolase
MAESRRVDVETEWNNVTRDHRLRVLFPLGANVSHSSAEGQFEVSRRPTRWPDLGNGWEEPFVPTLPQQGWVSVSNGRRGLTIANRGLPEYEVLPDGQGTVALTLLRAVGWLSREDLLGRTGGAGPSTPTPDAQCLGAQRVTYSVIPHAGDWLAARSYLHAQDFLVPLYGTSTGRHGGRLEMDDGLISLLGDHTLVTSACKKAEDSEALILRFWNVASEPTSARVVVRRPLMGVRRVDLREEPIGGEPLRIESDGSFSLDAGPSEIVTVALSLAEGTR